MDKHHRVGDIFEGKVCTPVFACTEEELFAYIINIVLRSNHVKVANHLIGNKLGSAADKFLCVALHCGALAGFAQRIEISVEVACCCAGVKCCGCSFESGAPVTLVFRLAADVPSILEGLDGTAVTENNVNSRLQFFCIVFNLCRIVLVLLEINHCFINESLDISLHPVRQQNV